jgi:hypothetical protein
MNGENKRKVDKNMEKIRERNDRQIRKQKVNLRLA